MTRKTTRKFDQGLIELYDKYTHGLMNRRDFLDKAAKYTAGGVGGAALIKALSSDYALAETVKADDPRITAGYVEYNSPNGHGTIRAYQVRPSGVAADARIPAVIVVHQNRGVNPHIEDVARRIALEGFMAFAPDGLSGAGGYPGDDDTARDMQRGMDRGKLREDFMAAFDHLKADPGTNGRIGVIGFCYGGGIANAMAVRHPDLAAAVPFYGSQPAAEDVPKIQAPLLLHYAGFDERINAGWPAYEEALKANGKEFTAHIYPDVNHAFHDDTSSRYDEAAATLAWERTIAFLKEKLA